MRRPGHFSRYDEFDPLASQGSAGSVSRLSEVGSLGGVARRIRPERKRLRLPRIEQAPLPDVQLTSTDMESVEPALSWIGVRLVDEAGDPIVGQRYELTLPDGGEREGKLDDQGRAREEKIEFGESTVSFPGLRPVSGGAKTGSGVSGPRESAEDAEYELAFVVEDEDSGMVLPFLPFRVLDAEGVEVASGETDAEGEAVVPVDSAAEFEVVTYTDAEHPLAGFVVSRASLEPVEGAAVEAEDLEGTRVSATSDADGRFDFGAQTQGFWLLCVEGVEYPVFLDGSQGEPTLFLAPAGDPPPEPENDWHEATESLVADEDSAAYVPVDLEDY